MAVFNKFNSFVANLANGKHNLASGAIKIALTNTSPTAPNTAYTDITALIGGVIPTTNLSGTTTALDITTISSTQISGTYKLDLTDKVLTATGAVGPFRYVTLYNATAAGFELIGWYDYGSSITLATGETFTVNFDNVNGVFTLV
jgi:hypothetical protein